MAYKQKWGVSRKRSPLNNESQGFGPISGQGKDSDTYKSQFVSPDVDVDPSRNDIIQQNNKVANQNNEVANQNSMNIFKPGLDLKGQAKKKVLTQIAKSGVLGQTVKNVGKLAARANPIATFFQVLLGSQSAYAPNIQDVDHGFYDPDDPASVARWEKKTRLEDIQGMSKREILEYDKKKALEKKNMEIKEKTTMRGSGPKHMLSQG